jgi:hypothetical protein
MEFTKEQFEEIGPWHFHDLCFDSSDQDFMHKIFNLLPSHLQGIAISWGCDDSVFRDDVYEYLVKNQFGMTCEEYRNSEIGKGFFKNGTYQTFDFEKLKPKKVLFDIETEGITTVMIDGKVTQFKSGIPKLDEIMSSGFKKGELGIIMAPVGIGKYNPDKGRYDEKIQNLINKHNKDA